MGLSEAPSFQSCWGFGHSTKDHGGAIKLILRNLHFEVLLDNGRALGYKEQGLKYLVPNPFNK